MNDNTKSLIWKGLAVGVSVLSGVFIHKTVNKGIRKITKQPIQDTSKYPSQNQNVKNALIWSLVFGLLANMVNFISMKGLGKVWSDVFKGRPPMS